MIRTLAHISAAAIAALTLLLLIDWAVAASRQPKDDQLVKDIQEKVKTDASLAGKLAAEQKRVTDYRRSRKLRDNWAANGLIVAAIVFLVCANRILPRQIPAPPRESPGRPSLSSRLARIQNGGPQKTMVCPTTFVDEAVARLGRHREAAIALLQAIQQHYRYLPDDALRHLCEITEITPAQIAGASSFYGQFRRSPVGEHVVKVCHGTACHVAGARQITEELRRYLDIAEGQDTDPSRQFTMEEVACLGCCSLAPVLMVDGHTAGRLTPNTVPEAVRPFEKAPT